MLIYLHSPRTFYRPPLTCTWQMGERIYEAPWTNLTQSNLQERIKNLLHKIPTRLSSVYHEAIKSNKLKQRQCINIAVIIPDSTGPNCCTLCLSKLTKHATIQYIDLDDTKYLFRFPLLNVDVYYLTHNSINMHGSWGNSHHIYRLAKVDLLFHTDTRHWWNQNQDIKQKGIAHRHGCAYEYQLFISSHVLRPLLLLKGKRRSKLQI